MKKQVVFTLHEVNEILANYVFDNDLIDSSVIEVDIELQLGSTPSTSYVIVKES